MISRRGMFFKGLRDATPIGLGYLAVSFAFGLSAHRMGLSAFQIGLMSMSNLSSAGQFAGTAVIVAGGSLIELMLTQLVVNARYFLMSCSLSQRLPSDTQLWQRALLGFGVTDEIFALSITLEKDYTPFYSYGMLALCVPCWTLGSVLGALLGGILPAALMNALGIALYAMLVAAILPPSREDRVLRWLIAGSMLISAAFAALPLLKEISKGIRVVLLTLLITGFAAWKFPVGREAP